MRFAVAEGVAVAKAITDERPSAPAPGSGAVRAPVLAEEDILDQVEERGLSRSERAGDEDLVRHVDDLAEAIPIHRDDAGERNALWTHGAASAPARR